MNPGGVGELEAPALSTGPAPQAITDCGFTGSSAVAAAIGFAEPGEIAGQQMRRDVAAARPARPAWRSGNWCRRRRRPRPERGTSSAYLQRVPGGPTLRRSPAADPRAPAGAALKSQGRRRGSMPARGPHARRGLCAAALSDAPCAQRSRPCNAWRIRSERTPRPEFTSIRTARDRGACARHGNGPTWRARRSH